MSVPVCYPDEKERMLKALIMSELDKGCGSEGQAGQSACTALIERAGGKWFGCFKVCSEVLWAEWDQPHIPRGISHCLEPIYFVFI